MKKRDKLSLISSILGVFALCGLSALAIFSKPKEEQIVKADTSYDLYVGSGLYQYDISYNTDDYPDLFDSTDNLSSEDIYISVNFLYRYSYHWYMVNNETTYQFHINYGMYFVVTRYNVDLEYWTEPYTWFLNYDTLSSSYVQNPSINNLPKFDYYSIQSSVSTNFIKFDFLGLTSFNGFNYRLYNGESFWYFDNADYWSGGSYQWVDSSLVDSQNFICEGSDYKYVSAPMERNGGYNKTVINDSFTYEISSFDDGVNVGYQSGYEDGYNSGKQDGYNQGYDNGVIAGEVNGYNDGYSDGYNDGFRSDSVATTIMSGIFQVALVPINFFLAIFNFEILGVNLTSVIQAIFTVTITIIIIKMVIGSKGD